MRAVADIVASLRAVAGDALRAVAAYDRDSIEVLYEREEIADKERVIDDIHRELVLTELGRERLEQLFRVGRWHCTMHRFDEAVCIHYSRGDLRGVFVSVDTGSDVTLERLGDICEAEWE